jgi:hypothetical protein
LLRRVKQGQYGGVGDALVGALLRRAIMVDGRSARGPYAIIRPRMSKDTYIVKSGPQVYHAATPQDALALGEQMEAKGMDDVWIIIIDQYGTVHWGLESLRYALKDVGPSDE